jgi:hypothetical protein
VFVQKNPACSAASRMSFLRRGAALLFALLLFSGCGGNTRPMPLDKQLARDSLTKFLQAWKNGEKIDALQGMSIVGSDEAWEAGAKLKDFSILEPVKDDGSNLHARVKLDLQMPDGGSQSSTVTYIVGTSPKISIFRK